MRKVIGGKVYDTETATKLVVVAAIPGDPLDDFEAENTSLYRTPKGAFFLAGRGGASSRWASRTRDGKGWQWGEGIKLIDAREAQELMELHDGPVEDYFEIEEA